MCSDCLFFFYSFSLTQEENLHDVLNLLLGIVFEDSHISGNVVKIFSDSNGLKYAFLVFYFVCSS